MDQNAAIIIEELRINHKNVWLMLSLLER